MTDSVCSLSYTCIIKEIKIKHLNIENTNLYYVRIPEKCQEYFVVTECGDIPSAMIYKQNCSINEGEETNKQTNKKSIKTWKQFLKHG